MTASEAKQRPEGLRRKALALASFLVLVSLVVGALFGDRGFVHLYAERRRAESLLRDIEDLRQDNARIAGQIQALRTNASAIEKIAREELGLVRPGEILFLVPDDASPAR